MTITINSTACGFVSVDVECLCKVSCLAPIGSGSVFLEATVGSQSSRVSFAYDPPKVMAVFPSPVDALSSSEIITVCQQLFPMCMNTVRSYPTLSSDCGQQFGPTAPVSPSRGLPQQHHVHAGEVAYVILD